MDWTEALISYLRHSSFGVPSGITFIQYYQDQINSDDESDMAQERRENRDFLELKLDMVEILLKKGAEPNKTVLSFCFQHPKNLLQLLIQYGADLDQQYKSTTYREHITRELAKYQELNQL